MAHEASQEFFDSQAAEWDAKPNHRAMAEQAVQALVQRVTSLSPESTTALEFGCGTGLGSSLLLPHVAKIVGVDTSAGMVEYYNKKAASLGVEGKMNGLQLLLKDPKEQLKGHMPEGGFHLVFSHLTLHHVEDITGIVKVLVDCLRSDGGILAVSDFKLSDHSKEFHPTHVHQEVKHHGICPKKLKAAMEAAGLCDVDVSTTFEFEKPVEGGGAQKFEFLLGLGVLKR